MAKSLDIKFGVQGVDEVKAALSDVRRSVAARVLKSAVTHAIKPLVPAAKAVLPSKFGTLKRSLISRVKRYTRGSATKAVVVALVGPETKFTETKRVSYSGMDEIQRVQKPSKYAHLVENGTKPHDVSIPGYGKKKLGSQWSPNVPSWRHPGTKPHPFLKPTAQAKQGEVARRFRDKALERIQIEWQRAKKNGKKFFKTD